MAVNEGVIDVVAQATVTSGVLHDIVNFNHPLGGFKTIGTAVESHRASTS